MKNQVLVIMGSDSDWAIMRKVLVTLREFAVDYEVHVASAHRSTDYALKLAREAHRKGFDVIIAGAGAAAHLPGVLAAVTPLPVIGIPINATALQGVDALYAMVQMPSGIPVATVAIDGAKNAALLAIQILGVKNSVLRKKLIDYKEQLAVEVTTKEERVQNLVREFEEKELEEKAGTKI